MKTILVLEDDLRTMQVFCAILNSMAYRVFEATTGKEAIEIFGRNYEPASLFASDLSLPNLSGTEVALPRIQLQPDLAILSHSGTPIDHWRERNQRSPVSGARS